ncbi:hypothetical protein E2562_027769 [Oryza meyeriana var. granulata]|uniref:K+ potassium transporter integral membrane domain-containing protein n=1 Tax=Oryza meyeriana var. granulata TaxID=110450 RepID=A0A6G1EBK8_9ORYZ|nr:hypothetical protein E2562_027769 [Oryza meyeriana var. granulata]
MRVSKVTAGEAARPTAGNAKAYPYVVGVHCQCEASWREAAPASWVMDDGIVLRTFNPKYILDYWLNGYHGWVSLGGVLLCYTVTEALFASYSEQVSISVIFLLALRLLPPKMLPAIPDADESEDLALFRRTILSSSATPTPSSAVSYFFRRRLAPKAPRNREQQQRAPHALEQKSAAHGGQGGGEKGQPAETRESPHTTARALETRAAAQDWRRGHASVPSPRRCGRLQSLINLEVVPGTQSDCSPRSCGLLISRQ